MVFVEFIVVVGKVELEFAHNFDMMVAADNYFEELSVVY
jgi:hypothetical protein